MTWIRNSAWYIPNYTCFISKTAVAVRAVFSSYFLPGVIWENSRVVFIRINISTYPVSYCFTIIRSKRNSIVRVFYMNVTRNTRCTVIILNSFFWNKLSNRSSYVYTIVISIWRCSYVSICYAALLSCCPTGNTICWIFYSNIVTAYTVVVIYSFLWSVTISTSITGSSFLVYLSRCWPTRVWPTIVLQVVTISSSRHPLYIFCVYWWIISPTTRYCFCRSIVWTTCWSCRLSVWYFVYKTYKATIFPVEIIYTFQRSISISSVHTVYTITTIYTVYSISSISSVLPRWTLYVSYFVPYTSIPHI